MGILKGIEERPITYAGGGVHSSLPKSPGNWVQIIFGNDLAPISLSNQR